MTVVTLGVQRKAFLGTPGSASQNIEELWTQGSSLNNELSLTAPAGSLNETVSKAGG